MTSKSFSRALILCGLIALSGCGQPATTPGSAVPPVAGAPTRAPLASLGVYELSMNEGRGSSALAAVRPAGGLSAQATEVGGLSFRMVSMSNVRDTASGVIHMTAAFEVTNNSGADLSAPAFIPLDTEGAGATTSTTPFVNIRYADGRDASAVADQMSVEVSHTTSGGAVVPDPNATPLISGLNTGDIQVPLSEGRMQAGISHSGWQTPAIPNGGKQVVTFAARVPMAGTDPSRDDAYSFKLVFTVADNPGTLALTNIAEVQGSTPSGDAASPLSGTQKTVEGVVTSVHTENVTGSLKGFYLQEEGIDADRDGNTSDGVFVYCNADCPADLKAGERVRVTGSVSEFGGATQITTTSAQLVRLVAAVALPPVQTLSLPLDYGARERLESMRVSTSGVVTNNFTLGRGASFDIADSRIMNFTQLNAPSQTGNAAYQAAAKNRYIRIDDGTRRQNPDPEIFARNGQPLSAANTLRGGDTVTVTGVLGYSNDGWSGSGSLETYRIHTTQAGISITGTNPRLAAPEEVGGSVRVGSMNVLNYFTTLVTSNTGCTPNGVDAANSRGANNCDEFLRQQTKIVKAITGLNPDVLGVLEMQNDFDKGANSSIAQLVSALNAQAGAGTYAYINPGAKVGTDAISVAMIYKPSAVTPVGNLAILNNSFDSKYADTCNRPTLAHTFQSNANGGRFTAVMMHLKSKGSACAATNDADMGDGQGNGYIARRNAATAIVNWLATNPTGIVEDDRILLGDYNAYAMEEPLTILAAGGYGNLFDKNVYSYQFDGQWGSLDQALASSSLQAQVAGQTKWHINADEPTVLDYNLEFKTAGQVSSFYAPDPFRSSDHDPILVGMNLTAQTPIVVNQSSTSLTPAGASGNVNLGSTATQTFTTSSTNVSSDLAVSTQLSKTDGAPAETNPVVTAPATAAANGTFDVSLATTSSTTPGAYRVTVNTASGTASASATYDVNVNGIVLTKPGNLSYTSGDAGGATTSASATTFGTGNVTYTATATGADTPPTLTVTAGTPSGNTTPLTIAATGGSAGSYTATLVATGANGQSASTTFTVTISNTGVGKLVISEFRFRGPSGGNDEFYELHNIGTAPITVTGWKIQGMSSSSTAFSDKATLGAVTIPAGGFYLVTNSGTGGYSGSVTGDMTFTSGTSDNRALRIVDANGTVYDLVGFAGGAVCENSCIANGPTSGVTTQISWARRVVNGQIVDTDNNAMDFVYRDGTAEVANPQNSTAKFAGNN
ncbi:ExeM/NucH family extracellular endonuclease [Deinococcus hohokamensis]|uniref:ExeM/NucH family extracellular endonuclease n=1 Tax=Deinococcus hohokamensis TaxID=309883 RepID=A0ABV9IB22_9DEIO